MIFNKGYILQLINQSNKHKFFLVNRIINFTYLYTKEEKKFTYNFI